MIFSTYKPSKVILSLCIMLSVCLHLFVCKIPVESKMPEKQVVNKISFSLISRARQSFIANDEIVKEVKKIEKIQPKDLVVEKIKPKKFNKKVAEKKTKKIDLKKKIVEKKEIKKPKQKSVITANNTGRDVSTVVPTLTENDYVKTVIPRYPNRAVDLGQQGVVMVKVKVKDGVADRVDISKSSGYSSLDKSAVKAVKKWQFKQVALSRSNAGWVQIPVEFIIK